VPLIEMKIPQLVLLFSLSPLMTFASNHDSSRWERSIARFEAADKKQMPVAGGVLFIGSSSIRRWKSLKNDFSKFQVINRGFGGSHIADSVHFAKRIVLPYKPRQIVLYAGDNDVASGKSPETVLADFQQFVKIVHAKLPKTLISFISIKPSLSRWKLSRKMAKANELVHGACVKDERLGYIDIWKPMLGDNRKPKTDLFVQDGLHINDKGYALWVSIVRPHLAKLE